MPRSSQKKLKSSPLPTAHAPVAVGQLWLKELRSKILGNTRLLRVWLPPEFDASGGTSYSVFYLNDGQNLFDPATAFAGIHWQVAESAARLISEKKIPPLIIIGIDNTRSRANEYIPYKSKDPRIVSPKGVRYPEFLQREVMPLIEERYPVRKEPESTGLGGSSLGGLITLYTQLAAPGVFGRLLIESPSLFVADRKILAESRRSQNWPSRVYLGMGTREVGNSVKDDKVLADVRDLESVFRSAGLDESRLRVRIDEGATHSEAAWASRFPDALEFLFSP